jgi:hypothetical protein
MARPTDPVQDTFDLPNLKTIFLESKHRQAIAKRIQPILRKPLQIEQASLYAALRQLIGKAGGRHPVAREHAIPGGAERSCGVSGRRGYAGHSSTCRRLFRQARVGNRSGDGDATGMQGETMKELLKLLCRKGVLGVPLAVATLMSAQNVDQLIPHQVKLESVVYLGKRAVKITEDDQVANGEPYAIVKGTVFHNGAIEIELAGRPAAGAGPGARGFIGVAFRLQDGQFENIYLRPTNGRADDQVRRNHSTQYSSHPKFTFAVLRQQSPEKYESYVDLEPGVWTRYRITVEGTKARLYVHGASQPCLIVNDLKLGDSSGGVALSIGPGTEGYFTGLEIRAVR